MIKGLIKSRKPDNAMAKRTNNDLQNAIQKTKFRVTRAPQKNGDELLRTLSLYVVQIAAALSKQQYQLLTWLTCITIVCTRVLAIYTLRQMHFNAMLKTSIKDKLVFRFSSACFEPIFATSSSRLSG
jgi:hypothetical protein